MRYPRILGVLLLTAVLAAACGNDGGTDGASTPTSPAATETGGETGGGEGGTITIDGQEANDHGTTDVTGQSSIELELDDFYFEPTVLTGSPGQSLALEASNAGDAAHTFTIEDQGIDEELEPGDTRDIDVTFPDSGMVVFICRFHAGQGMRGALEAAA